MNPQRKPRERDPVATRRAILAAARTILAKDGPEGLSVAQVAMLAGINRGTAYQHFPDRKELLNAAIESVSAALIEAVWPADESPLFPDGRRFTDSSLLHSAGRLAEFTVQNTAFCRVWLFEMLSSENPLNDPFGKAWFQTVKSFCASEDAVEGIDAEAYAAFTLMAYVAWPVMMHTEKMTPRLQKQFAHRLVDEVLRSAMCGIMKPERFPTVLKALAEDGKLPPGYKH